MPTCWNPSLQFSAHGAVPVRTIESGVDCPAQIVAPPETAAVGRFAIGMSTEELGLQGPEVTVAWRWTAPLAPAVKVTVRALAPPVIVPFVIDQAYVAPAPASGTEAVSPVVPLQADAGAVIEAEGGGVTVTFALPLANPTHFVSVTDETL